MFGAYVRENRKVVIALAVYTAVFAFIFWLYRLPLGAVGYAALVCLFLLLVWLAVDYRRFAARLCLLRRLEQEITLSTEQLPEPDGALEAQYQALVRALDADRRAQLTRSQQGYQDLVEYYTVWAHQIKTPIAAMRLLLQDADTDEQRALLEQLQSVEQYVEMVLGYLRLESPSSDYVIRNYALDDIVRQAVRKYASQFIRRKLRLEYTPLTSASSRMRSGCCSSSSRCSPTPSSIRAAARSPLRSKRRRRCASATRASASRPRICRACLKRATPAATAARTSARPASACTSAGASSKSSATRSPLPRRWAWVRRCASALRRTRSRSSEPYRIVSFRRENVSRKYGSHFPGGLY